MYSVRKPRWQQATALVSLSTAGAMTGIAFAHGTLADMTSPTSMPLHLLEFKQAAGSTSARDSALRSAIVKSANYYLRLAEGKTPAEMEALIWQNDSIDGVDHGESCAAFASLTLEAGAQAAGQQSWVTGGASYPWPLHGWADVRVDPNPASPGIISILQDAEAHNRWHPLGDGYSPQPGDWVLFAGHVEVVTKYAAGVLHTIGGDSLPNLSVNAHQYDDPLAAQGVAGFVNNGELLSAVSPSTGTAPQEPAPSGAAVPAQAAQVRAGPGQPAIPGLVAPAFAQVSGQQEDPGTAQPTGVATSTAQAVVQASAAIPGSPVITGNFTSLWSAPPSSRYSRSQPVPSAAAAPGTPAQQAFINEVAAGALAAQERYGVPAAVTIAQAIDESGWGQSQLAAQDNNLFGIKGTGPAGSVMLPTQEYLSGQWVTITAPFRVYHSVAESIEDHTLLLATGSSYKQAMADRQSPDAFANDLTGVYATDPNYGTSLIGIMRLYNLYRYDAASAAAQRAAAPRTTAQGGAGAGGASGSAASSGAAQAGAVVPGAARVPGTFGPAPAGGFGAAALGGSGAAAANRTASAKNSGSAAANGTGTANNGVRTAVNGSATAVNGSATTVKKSTTAANGSGVAAGRSATAPNRSATAVKGSATATSGSGITVRGSATAAARSATTVRGSANATNGSAAARNGAAAARSGAGAGPAAPGLGTAANGTGAADGSVVAASGGFGAAGPGGARIPGVPGSVASSPATTPRPPNLSVRARARADGGPAVKAGPRNPRVSTKRYVPQMPAAVMTDFITSAKTPLLRSQPLYQDVASNNGLRWELLAACDWMQCKAQAKYSPVHGERLGSRNSDGTVYRMRSQALAQVASDLIELAGAVYGMDLTGRIYLSVRELANVFAAFRWGGLLKAHQVSAMEFPYSVAGLTPQHLKMRWPDIRDVQAPDKPGTRFRGSFGAVPVVLGLGYPAVA